MRDELGNASASLTARESQTQNQLQRLEKAAVSLLPLIEGLESRLQRASRPTPPVAVLKDDKGPPDVLCPIAEDLRAVSAKLAGFERRLQQMIELLEI